MPFNDIDIERLLREVREVGAMNVALTSRVDSLERWQSEAMAVLSRAVSSGTKPKNTALDPQVCLEHCASDVLSIIARESHSNVFQAADILDAIARGNPNDPYFDEYRTNHECVRLTAHKFSLDARRGCLRHGGWKVVRYMNPSPWTKARFRYRLEQDVNADDPDSDL